MKYFVCFIVLSPTYFANNNSPYFVFQRMKCDTLLANVLHHNDVWNQQKALSDDMKKEILSLTERFKKKVVKVNYFVVLSNRTYVL